MSHSASCTSHRLPLFEAGHTHDVERHDSQAAQHTHVAITKRARPRANTQRELTCSDDASQRQQQNLIITQLSCTRTETTSSPTKHLQYERHSPTVRRRNCGYADSANTNTRIYMHRTVDSSTVRERGRAARTISAPQRTTTTPSKQHPPTHKGTEVTHKHKHKHTQTYTHTHTHDNNKTPPVQDRYATHSGGEHVDVLDDHNVPSPRYKTSNTARAAMATTNKQTQQTQQIHAHNTNGGP